MIPPPVTPEMIFSDRKTYSSSVGRKTMTTAANRPPQSPVYCMDESTLFRPGPTGIISEDEAKISEIKYSFQIFIKVNINNVTVMGFISWKITRKNNVHVPQPSKMAASSISLGIDFNAPIYRKIPSGRVAAVSTAAAPINVFKCR